MLQRLKSRKNAQSMQKVNSIEESEEEEEEEKEEECEEDEEQLVLRVDREGSKALYMEWMMCGIYFKAIVDAGSPVSIFTNLALQKIVGDQKVVIRVIIGDER